MEMEIKEFTFDEAGMTIGYTAGGEPGPTPPTPTPGGDITNGYGFVEGKIAYLIQTQTQVGPSEYETNMTFDYGTRQDCLDDIGEAGDSFELALTCFTEKLTYGEDYEGLIMVPRHGKGNDAYYTDYLGLATSNGVDYDTFSTSAGTTINFRNVTGLENLKKLDFDITIGGYDRDNTFQFNYLGTKPVIENIALKDAVPFSSLESGTVYMPTVDLDIDLRNVEYLTDIPYATEGLGMNGYYILYAMLDNFDGSVSSDVQFKSYEDANVILGDLFSDIFDIDFSDWYTQVIDKYDTAYEFYQYVGGNYFRNYIGYSDQWKKLTLHLDNLSVMTSNVGNYFVNITGDYPDCGVTTGLVDLTIYLGQNFETAQFTGGWTYRRTDIYINKIADEAPMADITTDTPWFAGMSGAESYFPDDRVGVYLYVPQEMAEKYEALATAQNTMYTGMTVVPYNFETNTVIE